jgi:hypothetical protein
MNYYDTSSSEGNSISADADVMSGYYDRHVYLNTIFETKIMGRDYRTLYILLPKWHYLRIIVRKVILTHLKKM